MLCDLMIVELCQSLLSTDFQDASGVDFDALSDYVVRNHNVTCSS